MPATRAPLPEWWHDFVNAVSAVLDVPTTGPDVTWLSQAPTGRGVFVTAAPGGWLRELRRLQASGGTEIEMVAEVGSAGLAVVSPDDLPPDGTPIDVLFVDDVLLTVDDPAALMDRLSAHLRSGGELHVAVSVGPLRSPATKRSLGPCSLLGLLADHVVVRSLAVREHVMYAVGAWDEDETRRTAAALQALNDAQDPIEQLLLAGSVAARDLAVVRAQVVGGQAETRRLREELDGCHTEAEDLARSVDGLGRQVAQREAEADALRTRLDEAEGRMEALTAEVSALRNEVATEHRRREAIYASRWWRLGQVIRIAGRDPGRAGEALHGLVAALRGTGRGEGRDSR